MNMRNREKALETLKFFAAKIYGDDSASWLTRNWEYVLPWHFKFVEYLTNLSQINKGKVL